MNKLQIDSGEGSLLRYQRFTSDGKNVEKSSFCSFKKACCSVSLVTLIVVSTTVALTVFQKNQLSAEHPTFQPSLNPTLEPSLEPTSYLRTGSPTYYPTQLEQFREIYLENETPYTLCLTSSWQNDVYCKNGCKSSLGIGDEQVMYVLEDSPSYAKAGLYYNMEDLGGGCNGGFEGSFGVTVALEGNGLTASLTSDANGKVTMVQNQDGYLIYADGGVPAGSPSKAPASSPATFVPTATFAPSSSAVNTKNPTAKPSLSRAPTYSVTRSPTASFGWVISNGICYIDLGILYGQWVYANAINWGKTPYTLNKVKVDQEIDSILTKLTLDGVTEIRHAFSQIDNILNIENQVRGDSKDTISIIYSDNYLVEGTDKNFIQYMNFVAASRGFNATLSDGGALAGSTQMKLASDPQTSATTLLNIMNRDGFSKVDFDIESSSAFSTATTSESLQFFQLVKEGLEDQKKASVGTFMGCINNIPSVFTNHMNDYFSEVSLMLYSTSQYYLDATGTCWSLDRWIQVVGDPKKITILFYDSIPYENPSASAGTRYDVTGLTRGQAAASIYLQMLSQLGLKVNSLAPTGWWTDNPTTLPNNQVPQDFYDYLKQNG